MLINHTPFDLTYSDPIPLLEQALSQQQRLNAMQDLEVENVKLRETLDEYTKEFAQVKNQGIKND